MVHRALGTKDLVREERKDLRHHGCYVALWSWVEPAEPPTKRSFCRELGAGPQIAHGKGFLGVQPRPFTGLIQTSGSFGVALRPQVNRMLTQEGPAV